MTRIRARGISIDTVDLKERYRDIATRTREEIAELATESLQGIIDAINDASAFRRAAIDENSQFVSRGTQDMPLANARVKVEHRGNKVIVRVEHSDLNTGRNIFDMLDAGIPSRVVRGRFVFPAYSGHTTPQNSSQTDIGNPRAVRNTIASGNVVIQRDERGKPKLVSPPIGARLKKVPPRDFYRRSAEWVVKQLVEQGITTRFRRSKLRIKKSDIVIRLRK